MLTGDNSFLMNLCTGYMTIEHSGDAYIKRCLLFLQVRLSKKKPHLIPTLLVIFMSLYNSLILCFINSSSMCVSPTSHQCILAVQCLIMSIGMKIWSRNDWRWRWQCYKRWVAYRWYPYSINILSAYYLYYYRSTNCQFKQVSIFFSTAL